MAYFENRSIFEEPQVGVCVCVLFGGGGGGGEIKQLSRSTGEPQGRPNSILGFPPKTQSQVTMVRPLGKNKKKHVRHEDGKGTKDFLVRFPDFPDRNRLTESLAGGEPCVW